MDRLTAVLAAGLVGLAAAAAPPPQSLAPYVPTPHDIVERMLAFAQVTKADVVYDLGSGDGRIPIAAARLYGARGVGIELNAKLVEEARASASAQGVAHLVEFKQGDVMRADISGATVVTLYLLGSGNTTLRPLLQRQLRPGARVVSHAFSMGANWPADRVDQFTTERGDAITLYRWDIR